MTDEEIIDAAGGRRDLPANRYERVEHWTELLNRQKLWEPSQCFLQPRLVKSALVRVNGVELDCVVVLSHLDDYSHSSDLQCLEFCRANLCFPRPGAARIMLRPSQGSPVDGFRRS